MIRNIRPEDREAYLAMSDAFYHSEAVLHPVPLEVQARVFDEAVSSDVYLEVFFLEEKGKTAGYAVINKSFSSEIGGRIVWIEDLFIKPEFRSHGLGRTFFAYLEDRFAGTVKRFRLEADFSNTRAIALYKRLGFEELPYLQMVKDRP